MKKVLKDFIKKHGKSESGFTMVEILVAIALLAVVVAVVTSTIINATQTSEKFSQGTMNESQLLNAVSLITRDVSLAQKITYAGADAVAIETVEGNTPSNVYYFYWKGTEASIPSAPAFAQVKGNAARIPSQPGIVEYRVVNGDTSNPTVRTLIEGYNPGGNSEFPLFTYYNQKNDEILLDAATTPPHVSDDNLGEIRRVEIHFTSYIDARDNAMELKTSASPRFVGAAVKPVAGNQTLEKPQTPLLYGDITPRTNTGKVWWTAIAGAESYTIYRQNRTQTPLIKVAGTVAGNVTTFDDLNLAWGETFEYYVVAQGFAGDGDPSSKIRLRTTPQPTAFVNVDPRRGQVAGDSITGYTVARGLTNQLSWAPSTGENIKYKLYTVSGAVKSLVYDGPLTTYSHSGRSYGAVTRYVVVAYNDTIPSYNNNFPGNVTGGTSADSPYIDLESPPLRPTATGVARNDLTTPSATDATNIITVTNHGANPLVDGYKFKYGTADNAITTVGQSNTSTSYSHLPGWGSKTFYSVTAFNNAGESESSDIGALPPVELNQPPGPFSINSLANNNGYGYVVMQSTDEGSLASVKSRGDMSADWTDASGVQGYTINRQVSNSFGRALLSKSTVDYEDAGSMSGSSANFSGVQPGVIYTVSVNARASNGLVRTVSSTLLTRPDVPKRGILEATCLANGVNGNGQQLAMYVDADTNPKYGYANKTIVSYNKDGYVAAAEATVPISSSVFAWQRLDHFGQLGKILFRNYIASDAVADNAANFGTSYSERLSFPLSLEVATLAPFNGACNTTTGGKIIPQAGTMWGSPWVVPIYVCYGYQVGHDYSQYYVDPANRSAKGYVYQDYADGYQNWMSRNSSTGCVWRLAPKVGREPYWNSV